jgi:hypothetical protein
LRKRLLEKHPVLWLAGGTRMPSFGFMAAYLMIGLFASAAARWNWGFPPTPYRAYAVAGTVLFFAGCLLHLLFAAFLSAAAGRPLAEARRSGTLELIAATSLTTSEILRGQWLGLFRWAAIPLAAILLPNVLLVCWFRDIYSLDAGQRLELARYLAASLSGLFAGSHEPRFLAGQYFWAACATLPVAWRALGWTSMWSALRFRATAPALLAAPAAVLALPWIFYLPASGMLELLAVNHRFLWAPRAGPALWTAIALGVNLSLSAVMGWRLRRNFRALAAGVVRRRPDV